MYVIMKTMYPPCYQHNGFVELMHLYVCTYIMCPNS